MESQPQNPEFRNNPVNFHPCIEYNPNPHSTTYAVLQIILKTISTGTGPHET